MSMTATSGEAIQRKDISQRTERDMGFTLLEISGARFSTSKAADELNSRLMRALGLKQRYAPARLAIARSLSLPDPPPVDPIKGDDTGKTIEGHTLFGDGADLSSWAALIVEAADNSDLSRKDFQQLVAAHWHRGASLLWKEWEETEGDFGSFVTRVCENAGLRAGAGEEFSGAESESGVDGALVEPLPVPVTIRLGDPGTDTSNNQPVVWTLNAPGVSPHIAAMGTLGTGKTRTAMQLLRQAKSQSGCSALVFDFKGDLAEDAVLCEALGATVITCPAQPIPLDVLRPTGTDDRALNEAALRFRDSFDRVARSRLGGIQLDALRDAVVLALKTNPRARIADIGTALGVIYEQRERNTDAVTATFNDLGAFQLFEPKHSPNSFFQKTWIVDVHSAPETVQRLVAFLMFDALSAWIIQLKDAPLDSNGHRALRMILAVDEARQVLGYNHPSLINVVRMSRSKGCAVMLISQSPDDFAQEEEDFLENIGLTFSFRTNAAPGSLKRVFGESVDLAGLPNGVCITRLPDPSRRRPIQVQAWQ
jgi:DNA sulfur modification protein DndE